jgi:hypothetical protein
MFMYDHTIECLPAEHPLFHWKRIGVGGRSESEKRIETLTELIHANGHADATNLLLKCDIEGAEWDMYGETSNQVLRKFKQIVTEVHELDKIGDDQFAERVRRALANLTAMHRVVHVHGNNHGNSFVYGGVPLPVTLELPIMRIDVGPLKVSDETFPTPLDMPNPPGRTDFHLGRFAFD